MTGCDLCSATDVRTQFCDVCGVDYCEECQLGAHEAMHEVVAGRADREGWLG